jgi:glycine cleavage system H lipoate-binding protein
MVLFALTADFAVANVGWRMAARRVRSGEAPGRMPAWIATIPVGFLVEPGHVWIHRQSDQLVRLGSDGLASALLGKPETVRLLAAPGAISRGAPLAVLERQGRSLTLRSPVTGILIEQNADLDAEAVAADPFGRGWLASVRPSRDELERSSHEGDGARAFLASEWERVRRLIVDRALAPAAAQGATMTDGGSLQPGFLPQLPAAVCRALDQALFAMAERRGTDGSQEARS